MNERNFELFGFEGLVVESKNSHQTGRISQHSSGRHVGENWPLIGSDRSDSGPAIGRDTGAHYGVRQ